MTQRIAGTTIVLLICAALFAQEKTNEQRPDPPVLPEAPSQQLLEIPDPPPPVPPPTMTTLPASARFVPLTPRQKFGFLLRHTYSPYTFVSAAFNATYSQVTGDKPGYGMGAPGWGKRFGASLADAEARSLSGYFLFPVLLHEDPRYFAKRNGSFFQRGVYAASRVLLTRSDRGRVTFNASEWLSVITCNTLANAYYPERDRGVAMTVNRIVGGLGSDAGTYALREFAPDIKRLLLRIAPGKLQKVGERLP